MKVGLRPEHIRLGSPEQDGGIPGVVRFLEPSAPTCTSRSRPGGRTSRSHTDPDATVTPDDNVTLHFDPWRLHVFGADGHNLRRDAPRVESAGALIEAAS